MKKNLIIQNPKNRLVSKVLIAPLDWGLGHTTRCMPLIEKFIDEGAQVTFAGNQLQQQIVKAQYPDLIFVDLDGYNVKYSRRFSFAWSVFFQSFKILYAIIKEHYWLRNFLKSNAFDLIISDNRYGFFNRKNIQSVFITHQVFIKLYLGNFFDYWILKLNFWFIRQYSELWIPDNKEGFRLSGDLAHLKPIEFPHQFIGTLSRLNLVKDVDFEYDFLILLSGPEPQRSVLEELILKNINQVNYKFALVRGTQNISPYTYPHCVKKVCNLADTKVLSLMMAQSKKVICRSGYSSLLDLVKLKKCALLIPTPGQTEQIYLAEYLSKTSQFLYLKQSEVNEKLLSQLTILLEKTYISEA